MFLKKNFCIFALLKDVKIMKYDLMKKYQDVISLLFSRNPKNFYYGSFVNDSNGKTAFKLSYYPLDGEYELSNKTFKYMDTKEDALSYFVKTAQNRVF